MAANKIKSKTQKLEILQLVAKLDRRGWSQFQIRDEVERQFGTSFAQPMVSRWLKEIREEYRKTIMAERREAVAAKVEQYRDIRREAWLAWERSGEDAKKLVEEYSTSSESVGVDDSVTSEELIKRIITKEGRLPENAYLNTIMKTLEAERELLGLDEPKDKLVTLEQVMSVVSAFKDAARDVLAQHPELLKQFRLRTVQILPVAEVGGGSDVG